MAPPRPGPERRGRRPTAGPGAGDASAAPGGRAARAGLSAADAALWARVADSVTPLGRALAAQAGRRRRKAAAAGAGVCDPADADIAAAAPAPDRAEFAAALDAPPARAARGAERNRPVPPPAPPTPSGIRALDRHGLDASWDRRLARGAIVPDAVLDMHGLTLDGAWARLDSGLGLAAATGARVVLVITGKPRPRSEGERYGRGVIRAKLLDWLAAGPHAGRIAAVRPAHIRHGGAGAVYVVLRKAG